MITQSIGEYYVNYLKTNNFWCIMTVYILKKDCIRQVCFNNDKMPITTGGVTNHIYWVMVIWVWLFYYHFNLQNGPKNG